ncbi:hypothetical protein [Psychroserpens ponticola]|uniref:DKNYY family protein n=1 Tax=Psychroserpens ponticola TaxID=2932268 RepID=A0ABY7S234_9FLAO|nr:hypothetical protein [Psychroserpens ponticola]WCO03337.1 hypothetical protein MUN68_007495 [Psychroserpens ponticola]
MKKQLIFIAIILFYFYSEGQSNKMQIGKSYITLQNYNLLEKLPLTKKDSMNFVIRANDTLVLIETAHEKGSYVTYEYKDSTFLTYYKKIAFNEKDNRASDPATMKYWKNDIKIFFSKSISKSVKKEFLSFTNSISKNIDSLNIYQVKKIEDSNYVIYYFGDYEYNPSMTNNKFSNYVISWNGGNQIYRGSLKLDDKTNFSDRLRIQKMKSLFIKSLGHFLFIEEFDCESIFSDCYSENKKMMPFDLELLKYHYSYGICKGTDLKTFERQHRDGKKSLEKENHTLKFFHPHSN